MALKQPKSQKGGKVASHRHAPKQEKMTAVALGGKQTKGSGCGWEKGDVRVSGIVRVENKCTTKKSFSITREILEKIETAALSAGEIPAVSIDFLTPTGEVTDSVCVMPSYALEMIVGELRELATKSATKSSE